MLKTINVNDLIIINCINYYKSIPFNGIAISNNYNKFILTLYYKDGKLHNENGPAVLFSDNKYNQYYINGELLFCFSQEEFIIFLRRKKVEIFE